MHVLSETANGRRTATRRIGEESGALPSLTERELQVLSGMSRGRSNAEIGRELYLSEDTVKTHARRLFRKLEASDRAHAVAVGFRHGLVR
jgi:DNA-binding NarL/FixJ family response regulator